MNGDVPRTVLGLTAEAWGVGAFALVVTVICCQELMRFLAATFAVKVRVPVPLSRSFQEARKARRGVWR